MQDKFHFAITGQTASEIIYTQADATKPAMGMSSFKNAPAGRVLKTDTVIGKNYLSDTEIKQLERTVTAFFDSVEGIIERRTSFTMDDTSDINMVMVHEFQVRDENLPLKVAEALGTYQAIPSSKTFGVVNDSSRIVLMIDEAHRNQGSDLGDNIFEAFPNAARFTFTGTPLITDRHGEKKTYKRFGEYIYKYRLMDAVDDGTTLQILYEGRTADAALNDKHGFETEFENLFKERTEEELLAIKKKHGATGDILEVENRIRQKIWLGITYSTFSPIALKRRSYATPNWQQCAIKRRFKPHYKNRRITCSCSQMPILNS